MANYYKIALRSNFASYKKTKFINILKEKHPQIYNREMEYILAKRKMIDFHFESEEQEKQYKTETKEMYKAAGIPEYVIIEEECGKIYEYWTQKPVTASKVILDKCKITPEEATDYILDSIDYKNSAEYIFSKRKENIIEKTLQLVKKHVPTKNA